VLRKGKVLPALHAAPVMMSPMSHQGMERTYDNNIMVTDVISHGGHWDTIKECQMMVTTKKNLSVDFSLVSMKP